jgi:hypothetical protein
MFTYIIYNKMENKMFNIWPTNLRVYLNVPFSKKDLAKKYKCFWDNDKKLWYKQVSLKENNFEDLTGYELLENFNELFEFDIKYSVLNKDYFDERNFNIMINRAFNDLKQKWKLGETQKRRAEAEEARNKILRKEGAEEYRKEQDSD